MMWDLGLLRTGLVRRIPDGTYAWSSIAWAGAGVGAASGALSLVSWGQWVASIGWVRAGYWNSFIVELSVFVFSVALLAMGLTGTYRAEEARRESALRLRRPHLHPPARCVGRTVPIPQPRPQSGRRRAADRARRPTLGHPIAGRGPGAVRARVRNCC